MHILFWISIGGFTAWAILLFIYVVNYFQIRKYNSRHVRDLEIINESGHQEMLDAILNQYIYN